MARTKPGVLVHPRTDGTEAQITLDRELTTIGRADTCTIAVPIATVSRLHARIELQHERYVLFDSGSANGTFVNGRRVRITEGHQLITGDQIWLGSPDVALDFFDPEETLQVPLDLATPPLLIDERARTVQVYGVLAELSPLEYSLLLHLARNPGTVCTRDSCFLNVWGQPYDHASCEDALNACMTKLRRNLRAAAASVGQEAPPITTIQRIGFRLDADVTFTPPIEPPLDLHEREFGV